MFTLRQLEIFEAVVHHRSLTRAAKQLGVSQPALSQQIARLEKELGVRLFDRSGDGLELTEAGRLLAEKAGEILAATEEIRAALEEYASGRRARIAVGALASVARLLLPAALQRTRAAFPGVQLDVHEGAPGELIDRLYARSFQIALLNEASVARDHLSFARTRLFTDGYALVVPRGLELDGVRDPARDLAGEARLLLQRTIQFSFGTAHVKRVGEWYRRHFGRVEVVAWVRHYETALALVAAGLGVALVPQGTVTLLRPAFEHSIRVYGVPGLERRVVALYPGQYRHLEPWSTFLAALEEAGRSLRLDPVAPPPPFLRPSARPLQGGEADMALGQGAAESL